MRSVRMFALVSWILIASLAVAGFAAFSPEEAPAAPAAPAVDTEPAVDALPTTGGDAVGRVAALALTNGLAAPQGDSGDGGEARPYAPLFETLGPDGSTTTTTTPPPRRPAPVAAQTPSPAQPASPPPADLVTSNILGPCAASWYGEYFRGRLTASGEPYNPDDFTAAHKTLPLGTVVMVTRTDTGASVRVRINDRGPFVGNRCIDLSRAAMASIGGIEAGVVSVVIEY